jgi:ABC-2 type transport system permease protein
MSQRHVAKQHVGDAIRSEWVKFSSLRSNASALALLGVLVVGLGALASALVVAGWNSAGDVALNTPEKLVLDPLQVSQAGQVLAALILGVMAITMITGEYSSGTIERTLVAIPNRGTVVAAKAVVMSIVVGVVGALSELVSFVIGQLILSGGAGVPHVGLGSSHVVVALVAGDMYLVLLCLFAAGIGWALRRASAAVSVFSGLVFTLYFVAALLPGAWGSVLQKYSPLQIEESLLSSRGWQVGHTLTTAQGLAVMAVYAVVSLVVGAFVLRRRGGRTAE